MSTPSQPSGDEPRYGRRSAHWRPDGGQPEAPQRESPESPWPRYGQTSQTGGESGESDQQGEETPWPRYGGHPGAEPGPVGPTPARQAPGPGRAGPVLLIVAGIGAMLVLAPLVLVMVVSSALGWGATGASAGVANGSQVSIDQTGELSVYAGSRADPGCALTRSGAARIALETDPDIPQMVSASGVEPGTYTLRCSGVAEGQELVAFSGSDMRELWRVAPRAFGFASFVGFVGLAALIAGVVWLARRNRARRVAVRS